jgi:DNA-binding MarR family transcriptional regulator
VAAPNRVWHVVNVLQLAALLREELERALDPVGLSLAEHDVLMTLLYADGRLPMKEVAEIVLFSQSGITRVVDRLEHKGLVRRDFSSTDRRVCYAVLTDAARAKLHAEAMPAIERVVDDRFSAHITGRDADELRRIVLDLLKANGWWDPRRRTQGPIPARRR